MSKKKIALSPEAARDSHSKAIIQVETPTSRSIIARRKNSKLQRLRIDKLEADVKELKRLLETFTINKNNG